MLLPDDILPENSLYYNGALILEVLQNKQTLGLLDLFIEVKNKNKMTFLIFVLSLDWLYLIDLAIINNNGEVELCS